MQRHTALSAFAAHCVQVPVRERFMYEAVKRPAKLHERICHQAQDLFLPTFRDGQVTFTVDEPCLVHHPTKGFQEMLWRDIEGKIGLYGGLLVISLQARKFYAEAEANLTIVVWAGGY